MSSLLSFKKQIPLDTPYFWALPGTVGNVFIPDGVSNNPNSMVGRFSVAGAGFTPNGNFSSASTSLLRDMGRQIVSSGRTFRRVQVLTLSTIGGYTNSTWVSNNEGVTGSPSSTDDNDYNSYYVEMAGTSVPGGIANPIFRYG
ncbi:MAG: hypothetical protein EBT86_00370 [Actinobacteria bacterium]|nr:hypothetical protein [Actinomycetota bacterium]NDG27107.1 hypothetical protein [Pseudomonadota bacterium]